MGVVGASEFASLAAALPFGKALPDARYIHTCSLSVLPEEYTELVERAAEIASAPSGDFNVIKFDLSEHRVSLLAYPAFFEDGFPALERSWSVDLAQSSASFREYDADGNPPILHRKETLLPPDHSLQGAFRSLTKEAEQAGLLEDARAIGRKRAWQAKLSRVGLAVRGNELVESTEVEGESADEIHRHKTALVRYSLSSPMQQLWRHGYLDGDHTVFDYGCGRGDDLRALTSEGITASGWDPHFADNMPKQSADVVNLGFVLNVIEDATARAEALRGAWALTEKVLAVAVILGGRSMYERFRLFRDGVVTRSGTFQKYFKQSELREYVASVLDREPISIAPGILFVFKDDQEEQSFLAERELSRRPSTALPQVPYIDRPVPERRPRAPRAPRPTRWEANQELVSEFWSRCVDLGRVPHPDEFENSVILREKLGLAKTVYRRCAEAFGEEAVLERRKDRMGDRLVYLALNLFERRRSLGSLPESVRRDTKAFWGSYSTASTEAKSLLFSIGAPQVIFDACSEAAKAGLGYLDGQRAFFCHSSVMHELPSPLRVYLGCAARIYGEFEQVDLIKIHIGSKKVSLMQYDDFDGRAIPKLIERTKILLGAADYEVYSYGDEFPPTPLYFKGRYLPEGFPHREEQLAFDRKLSESIEIEMEEHGPSAEELQEILEDRGLEVHGFQLRCRSESITCLEEERFEPEQQAGASLGGGAVDCGGLSADTQEGKAMTILEAAVQVLRERSQPTSVADIYDAMVSQGLYTFGAKSPRSVLSGTLRNHIKKSPSPLIVEASPGTYALADSSGT